MVIRAIRQVAFTYADGGITTIFDGIIDPWMLNHFLDQHQGGSAMPLHYVLLRPTRNEALRRAQGRTAPDALVVEKPIVSLRDQFAYLGPLERQAIDTTHRRPEITTHTIADAIENGRSILTSPIR